MSSFSSSATVSDKILKIALCQVNVGSDKQKNIDHIARFIDEAKQAQLIVSATIVSLHLVSVNDVTVRIKL